jgi:hypothetical protein
MVLVVHEEGCPELLRQFQQVDSADVEVTPLVDRPRTRKELLLQGRSGDVVVHRHGDAGYGSIRLCREGGEGTCCPTSTIVPCFVTPAPVAQRIEHRPPEPVAQVRVLPGAPRIFPRQAAFRKNMAVLGRCRGAAGERMGQMLKPTVTAAWTAPFPPSALD